LGATHTVTGSKYLLEVGDKKILIDCGLFQGLKELRLRNWSNFPIDPAKIDAVILTHAHIDHSGYLPVLVKNGFTGKIYCTESTEDLCKILLPDSGYLQEEEARRANKYGYTKHKPAMPLYTMLEAKAVEKQFVACDYGHDYKLTDDVTFHFNIAGHILGAANVIVKEKNKSILFSGDLGRPNDPIIYPPHTREQTDFLVVESTYGAAVHDPVDPQIQLGEVITRTAQRGGTVIIPAFAVGRTQNLLYYLYQLRAKNRIPDIPIFLDSPLATSATDIFKKHIEEHRLIHEECDKICGMPKYATSVEDSKLIDTYTMPKVIISASGMAVGGRVLHHLRIFAGDARNTILFCGFQAAGTRGEKILRGVDEIKLLGDVVRINAEVVMLTNVSAHADSNEILAWLKGAPKAPQKTFITHGELRSSEALQKRIEQELKWNCEIPKYLEIEDL
jgi:metallo-beta-lactamase family protein